MDVLFHNAAAGQVLTSASDQALEAELLQIFDGLRMPLLRYAVSLGLKTADGEDVIQETFLALFRHLRAGKPQDNLRSWVFRVTHNLALKRRATYRNEATNDTASDNIYGRIDPAPGPEESLLFTERQAHLLRVLYAMPENDQACLRLRAEGLRYREIAEVLGISLGSVAAIVARSMEKLERSEVLYGQR